MKSSLLNQDRVMRREATSADSVVSAYLMEMQRLEDQSAEKESRKARNITELYCQYGFDLPIDEHGENELFSEVSFRPSASEMESKLLEMIDVEELSDDAIEHVYYQIQRQIIEFEEMPAGKNELIRRELRMGLDLNQIRDLLAVVVKRKKHRNLSIDSSELIRLKQYYDLLPEPEYRLEPTLLKEVRQAYCDLLVELEYRDEEISHRLIAFDQNQMKYSRKSRPFVIESWRDLQLAELQIVEIMRANRNKTKASDIYQEWYDGLHYFPEIPFHAKVPSIQPGFPAAEAIEQTLFTRMKELEISDDTIQLVLSFQKRFFRTLPESRSEMESYLIFRRPDPEEISAGYLAMREYLASQNYSTKEIDRRTAVYLNYCKNNFPEKNQSIMEIIYRDEIDKLTQKYYSISGLQ
jgi:hypothetical protein